MQSGDPGCREVWTLLCDISRKEFQKVYDRLGVSLDEHGESFYNAMIPPAIDDLATAGLVTKDDGADIVRLEHFTYPLIVRKRDGEHLLSSISAIIYVSGSSAGIASCLVVNIDSLVRGHVVNVVPALLLYPACSLSGQNKMGGVLEVCSESNACARPAGGTVG